MKHAFRLTDAMAVRNVAVMTVRNVAVMTGLAMGVLTNAQTELKYTQNETVTWQEAMLLEGGSTGATTHRRLHDPCSAAGH